MTIEPFFINSVSESDLKPIPLTEEWLVRFGFFINHWESERIEETVYQHQGITIFYSDIVDAWVFPDIENVEIKYVHQLQNLYFALTGSELEIK